MSLFRKSIINRIFKKQEEKTTGSMKILGEEQNLDKIVEETALNKEKEKRNKLIRKTEALVHIGSWELDIVKNQALLSEEAYNILDVSPNEFEGTYEGFLKIIYHEDVKIIEKMVKFPSREPFKMELRILRSDGTIRHILQVMEFVFNNEDKPIYIFGIIKDITEKKN